MGRALRLQGGGKENGRLALLIVHPQPKLKSKDGPSRAWQDRLAGLLSLLDEKGDSDDSDDRKGGEEEDAHGRGWMILILACFRPGDCSAISVVCAYLAIPTRRILS